MEPQLSLLSLARAPRALPRLLASALLLVCLGIAPGCATTGDQEEDDITSLDQESRILQYRTVLSELREHPQASQARGDLELAQSWLNRIEQKMAMPESDRGDLDLLMQALEGQLIKIRTYFAKLDAEQALEAERSQYAQRAETINKIREENNKKLQAERAQEVK